MQYCPGSDTGNRESIRYRLLSSNTGASRAREQTDLLPRKEQRASPQSADSEYLEPQGITADRKFEVNGT